MSSVMSSDTDGETTTKTTSFLIIVFKRCPLSPYKYITTLFSHNLRHVSHQLQVSFPPQTSSDWLIRYLAVDLGWGEDEEAAAAAERWCWGWWWWRPRRDVWLLWWWLWAEDEDGGGGGGSRRDGGTAEDLMGTMRVSMTSQSTCIIISYPWGALYRLSVKKKAESDMSENRTEQMSVNDPVTSLGDIIRPWVTVHRHRRHHQRHFGSTGFIVADGREEQVVLQGATKSKFRYRLAMERLQTFAKTFYFVFTRLKETT